MKPLCVCVSRVGGVGRCARRQASKPAALGAGVQAGGRGRAGVAAAGVRLTTTTPVAVPPPAGALAGGPAAARPRGRQGRVWRHPRERGTGHDRLAEVGRGRAACRILPDTCSTPAARCRPFAPRRRLTHPFHPPPRHTRLPGPLPPRSFLIYNGSSDLLGGIDIAVLVTCLTSLLKHTRLVTSPPVHASIVQLLLAMLSPQVGCAATGAVRGRDRHGEGGGMVCPPLPALV